MEEIERRYAENKKSKRQQRNNNYRQKSAKKRRRNNDGQIVSNGPPKKRRKVQSKKTDGKVEHNYTERDKYLKTFDAATYGELHEQDFVKEQIKIFHQKQRDYQLEQCVECKRRWYASEKDVNSDRYVCDKCKKESDEPIPRWSNANRTIPGDQPLWARGLTQIEEMLVSPILPVMTVYRLKGGSNKFYGNSINFMQRLDRFVNILPRLPSQLKILIVRGPGANLKDEYFKVNVERIRNFCVNAKRNHIPGWDAVTISEENLKKLESFCIDDLPHLDMSDKIGSNIECVSDCFKDDNGEDDEREELDQYMITVPDKESLETAYIQQFVNNNNKDDNNQDAVDWPEREEQPVSEWMECNLASKCFPTLFANEGQGDPTEKGRFKTITFTEQVKYLLKVAYQNEDGQWIYPYAAHPRFAFWCLNMLQRQRACNSANVQLANNEGDEKLEIKEIQEMLKQSTLPPSFVRRLQRYGSKIIGILLINI